MDTGRRKFFDEVPVLLGCLGRHGCAGGGQPIAPGLTAQVSDPDLDMFGG